MQFEKEAMVLRIFEVLMFFLDFMVTLFHTNINSGEQLIERKDMIAIYLLSSVTIKWKLLQWNNKGIGLAELAMESKFHASLKYQVSPV